MGHWCSFNFPGVDGVPAWGIGFGMAERAPGRQMTVPKLLEARAIFRRRLEDGTGGAPIKGGMSGWNHSARDILLVELQEIES